MTFKHALLIGFLALTTACGRVETVGDENAKASDDIADMASGVYPSSGISALTYEVRGGFPHPMPNGGDYHRRLKILMETRQAAVDINDMFGPRTCNFILSDSEFKLLGVNLLLASLVPPEQNGITTIDAGNSYLKFDFADGSPSVEHVFEGGDSTYQNLPLVIDGRPLRAQLAQIDSTCNIIPQN